MSRFVSSLNETACANNQPIAHFADFDWPTGRTRLTDWPGDIAWGGFTWKGLGTLGALGPIQESIEIIANPVQAGLYVGDVIDDAIVTSAMSDRFQGKAAVFYIGWFADNGQLVDTPETLWAGRLDTMEYDIAASALTVTCEYRLRKEPPTARMTDEDQKVRFSGDRFFDLIAQIANYTSQWGVSSTVYPPPRRPPPPNIP